MKIIITNHIDIKEAPETLLRKIRTTFTLRNPAYDDAVKMGRWLGNLEEYLYCYTENAGTVRVLIATGQLIGEGFDEKSLQTLFLATPIKFDGRLIQYLGRVMRPAPGKEKAKVYDYIDENVGVLRAAANSRQRVYGHMVSK